MLSEASYHNMTVGRIPSVEGGIQPTIVDAKGDLIAAVAADSLNRLAVGSNDQVLVADSTASTGLAWKSYGAQFVAGKNRILNSDFSIWQRGTSFSSLTDSYTADRWKVESNRTGSAVSQQTFTPGTAPVTGYEGTYFLRYTCGTSGAYSSLIQRIEDVRTFANTTVTLSYWAKCSTGTITNEPYYFQNFGSGGSTEVQTALATSTITTSWQRFTQSFTIPSISGKTIGTSSYLALLLIRPSAATSTTIDVWGVQLEAGSVATPFTTATGTIQGELAACQRYYIRWANQAFQGTPLVFGGTNSAYAYVPGLNQMRTVPTTATTYTNAAYNTGIGAGQWAMGVDGAGYATKTGTISVNLRTAGISFTGATYSLTPPNFFLAGDSTLYMEASAEL